MPSNAASMTQDWSDYFQQEDTMRRGVLIPFNNQTGATMELKPPQKSCRGTYGLDATHDLRPNRPIWACWEAGQLPTAG